MKIYQNFSELVGKTPLLELKRIEREYNVNAHLWAKIEYYNPAGSIKDRVAVQMINDALACGRLKIGDTVIEPTSGNTGIGLAAYAASLGLHAIMVMPDTMSKERRDILKIYGAELVLTDGTLGMSGAIAKANELASEIEGSMVMGQFENPSNISAHTGSTAPEIWEDTDGLVDIVIAGVGTGGTISGIGKYLKEKNPEIKIIGYEPKTSPAITEGRGGAHKIQGIGAGFIPKNFDTSAVDEVVTVENGDAYAMCRVLPLKEGILAGISSGGALAAAIDIAKRPENQGKNIVLILPDTGMRYLSDAELWGV